MTLILSGTDGLSDIDGSAATPAIRGTDANTGIFFPAADTIAFSEGGVEAMRIDASGNLGLGVTPKSGSGGVPAFEISGSGTGFTSQGAFNAFSQNAYYASGWKYAATGAAASYWQDGGVHKWFTAPSGTANNAISFTQAMTLDASGNLGVGETSPGSYSKFVVRGGSGNFISYFGASTQTILGDNAGDKGQAGTVSNHPFIFITNATQRASITSGGDFRWSDNGANGDGAMIWVRNGGDGTANSGRLSLAYNTVNWTPASTPDTLRWDGNSGRLTILTSAKKYKRNITPVTDQQLDKALKLEPSYYQRLEYEYWEYGFIADQADEIGLNEIVSRVNGEINGLDYEKIGVFAIGLIKRHQKTLEQQQAVIEELKAIITALTARIDALEGK